MSWLSSTSTRTGRGRALGLGLVSAAVLAGCAASAVLAAPVAAAATPSNYVCTGGNPIDPQLIPPGNYGSVTVTGSCYMEGTYAIAHGLTVASGAELDAAVFFPAFFNAFVGVPSPYTYGVPCDVFLTVSGGVRVMQGAVLYLGNSAGTMCQNTSDVVSVQGGIRAVGAAAVVVHGTTVNGGISVTGGDAGPVPGAATPFGPYVAVEDSTLNGGATLSGNNILWLGFSSNTAHGVVTVSNNTVWDPDIDVGANTIDGNLVCSGNVSAPGNTPDSPNNVIGPGAGVASPNMVTGMETGQCAGL